MNAKATDIVLNHLPSRGTPASLSRLARTHPDNSLDRKRHLLFDVGEDQS